MLEFSAHGVRVRVDIESLVASVSIGNTTITMPCAKLQDVAAVTTEAFHETRELVEEMEVDQMTGPDA